VKELNRALFHAIHHPHNLPSCWKHRIVLLRDTSMASYLVENFSQKRESSRACGSKVSADIHGLHSSSGGCGEGNTRPGGVISRAFSSRIASAFQFSASAMHIRQAPCWWRTESHLGCTIAVHRTLRERNCNMECALIITIFHWLQMKNSIFLFFIICEEMKNFSIFNY